MQKAKDRTVYDMVDGGHHTVFHISYFMYSMIRMAIPCYDVIAGMMV